MPHRFECDGIGTHWWFEILDNTYPDGIEQRVKEAITQFDDKYSRFKPTSYVGQLNDSKRLSSPPPELVRMFRFAKQMYEVSGGAFDMSVGGELHAKGYGSRKLAAPIHDNMWRETIVSPELLQIPQNVVIDNGGFGKGWLIDSIGDLFRGAGIEWFVINGGGDILVSADKPLTFGLEHPLQPDRLIGSANIQSGALAGSSNGKRTWRHAGETYHHIVDPRVAFKKVPTQVSGTFVHAPTALLADTMATIVFLRPELSDMLEGQFDLKTMIIPSEAKTQTSL